VPPGKEDVEIQYTALSFVSSDQIRFRYRLEGLDSTWVEAGRRRTAYYSHLPAGDYRFRLIAASSDGVWNGEERQLLLSVRAPFYRTRWFEGLLGAIAVTILAGAWRMRIRQYEQRRAQQQAFSRQLIA